MVDHFVNRRYYTYEQYLSYKGIRKKHNDRRSSTQDFQLLIKKMI